MLCAVKKNATVTLFLEITAFFALVCTLSSGLSHTAAMLLAESVIPTVLFLFETSKFATYNARPQL